MRTFKDWPPALRQEPKQLADAGFYYIGLSDQTKCFYCEGGLRNWQPDDDPWTEHARWFSKCGYVRLIKGDEFITKCLNERPPQTPGGSKKDCQVSEEDLKAWMTSPVVIHVLNMGIDDSRIKMALKKHGKLYTDANTLATAALSMQMEEQVRMIPSQNPESQDTTPRPARSESAPCPPSTSVQLQNEDPATSKASGKCFKRHKTTQNFNLNLFFQLISSKKIKGSKKHASVEFAWTKKSAWFFYLVDT